MLGMDITKRDSMDAINIGKPPSTKPGLDYLDSSSPSASTLITLPDSILNRIYAHLLDTELVNLGLPNISYTTPNSSATSDQDDLLFFTASRSPFSVCTSLFYVCISLRKSALQYFYSRNLFIRLRVRASSKGIAESILLDSGMLFSTAKPQSKERCKQHVMDLELTVDPVSAATAESLHTDDTHKMKAMQKRAEVLFPALYLPRLITYIADLQYRDHSTPLAHHKTEICTDIRLQHIYSHRISTLQTDVLEPFRFLEGISGVSLSAEKGILLPEYGEGLKCSMLASEGFSVESLLDCVSDLAARGTAILKTQEEGRKADLAVEYAHTGVMILTSAYLMRGENILTLPESIIKEVQRLRWKCEVLAARALYAVHQQAVENETEDNWLFSARVTEKGKKTMARDLLQAERRATSAVYLSTTSYNPSSSPPSSAALRSNPWATAVPVSLIPPHSPAWFTDEERGEAWFLLGLVHAALGEYLFAAGDLERACAMATSEEGQRAVVMEKVEAYVQVFGRVRERIYWGVRPGQGLSRAGRMAKSEVY